MKKIRKNKNKSQQVDFSYFKPFGPGIARIKLPDTFYKKMLNLTNDIIADKGSKKMASRLAGQLEKEFEIPLETLEKNGLTNFLNICCRNYVLSFYKSFGGNFRKLDVELESCWVNSQYENEYNPVHFHTGCTLSAVFYLKIPEMRPRDILGKQEKDGYIEWIYHAGGPEQLEIGSFNAKPEEGYLYIWPSQLHHTVYPFLGNGERRSVAFNAKHRTY